DGARPLRQPGAPLHRGAPGRAATARGAGRAPGPPDRDPRPAPRPDRPARGLPLRPALSVRERPRHLRDARARAAPDPHRPLGPQRASLQRTGARARGGAGVSEALLQVTDLQKYFPIRDGVLIERTVDYVRAV